MSEDELAGLLMETGHNHHKAYEASDGTDPEWALFYAGYLQARLWDRLGRLPTRTELIYLLVSADKAFQATGEEYKEWPRFYAKRFLEHFAPSGAPA